MRFQADMSQRVIAEETGTFRGQCTELCGQAHGFMPVVVEVVEQAEFDAWYAERQQAAAAIKRADKSGLEYGTIGCPGRNGLSHLIRMACHQQNGQVCLQYFRQLTGSEIAIGPIENYVDVVLNGVAGTAMAAFGT